MSRLRDWFSLVRFSHSIFALPFAYLGMILAVQGWPGWRTAIWITVAMAAAPPLWPNLALILGAGPPECQGAGQKKTGRPRQSRRITPRWEPRYFISRSGRAGRPES